MQWDKDSDRSDGPLKCQKMWSSPMFLSLSSVFALLGLALVGIAVITDNWTEYQVGIIFFLFDIYFVSFLSPCYILLIRIKVRIGFSLHILQK